MSQSPTGPTPPKESLAMLIAGNRRFVAGSPRYGHRVDAAMAAATEQRPYAAVVSCMDARVAVEAVFDQDFGDVCVIRSAGHVVDRVALASIDLAIATFELDLVLVLGHTRCAAVATATTMGSRRLPGRHSRFVLDEIREAAPAADAGASPDDIAAITVRRHVARTVARVASILPEGRTGTGPVRVAGAIYDVDTGRVTLL